MAAICLSSAWAGFGPRRWPQTCAAYASKARMRSPNDSTTLANHASRSRVCSASPRRRMSSTPWRNSPTEIAERNTGALEAATVSKNAITPRFALACFRASLITLVSIKYMRGEFGRVHPLEILVEAHVRHRRQNLSEGASARTRERRRQDCAMLRFGAAAVRPGALLDRPDDLHVDSAHEQI